MLGLELVDFITDPRRSLAILFAVISPVAATLSWLDSAGWSATGATALFAGAAALAVAAITRSSGTGLALLASSIALFAGGVMLGFGG